MEGNESCEHGKYCFVCSCLIAEHIEILVNNENVRLGEFPHYKGKSIHAFKNFALFQSPSKNGVRTPLKATIYPSDVGSTDVHVNNATGSYPPLLYPFVFHLNSHESSPFGYLCHVRSSFSVSVKATSSIFAPPLSLKITESSSLSSH